ncbi:MAG: hypothetical protein Q8O13_05330 [Candidatus Omnitrophota bacterium]|nr:hypothetical protein [Candidatus Omnitrophota bacterium]
MIKTKTLFILGAGASAPFEYPTGIQLRNLICGRTRKAAVVQALVPVNEKEDESFYAQSVDKFITEFSRSSLYSIDFFLEHRKEFMNIGKMTIASYLLPCERDQRLRDSGDNWYMYLYDRLKSSFEEFDKNEISFITFNYDRSLEQFLFEALANQFNKSYQECAEKIKNIPIIHLYGQLDFLPWQNGNGFPYLYQKDSFVRLRNARDNIKLLTEEREVGESQEFQAAYKLIEKADKIYILGFSFDETNLERLNVSLMKDKTITATAYELERSKRRWVEQHFRSKINTDIFLLELDALSLLKEHLAIE